MVNFSLFSERAQKIMVEELAKRKGVTIEEERARLIAEEAKRPSRTARNREALLAEEQRAFQIMQQKYPDVAKDILDNSTNIRLRSEKIAQNFVIELTEKLKLGDGRPEDVIQSQISNGQLQLSFGSQATQNFVTGAAFSLIEKFLQEIFGDTRDIKFDSEIQGQIDSLKKELEPLQAIVDANTKQQQELMQRVGKANSKSAREAIRSKLRRLAQAMNPISIKLTRITNKIIKLQDTNTKLVKITEAFRRQTEELKEFISRVELTQVEKAELEEAVQRGSALIGETLRRNIVLEKGVLQDIQMALREAAIKLQRPASNALDNSNINLNQKRDSVFNDQNKLVQDNIFSLEDAFGQPTQNIGLAVAEGIKEGGNLTQEELTEMYKKNITAQQRALIELGESP